MTSQRLTILVLASSVVLTGCAAAATPSPAPPSPASVASAQPTMQLMGRGQFHDVDGTATGEAQLIVAPDGTYEVVLESFSIGSIEHTNVALVKNTDVTATGDVDKSMLLDLGPLKSTSGMQDFPIPADMAGGVMEYHTVVIWDTAMAHAIAAAPLG
jgi:hypothetical protein